jgi:hypothetical protein
LNWRLKLANWLSSGAVERYQRQEEIAQAKLKQNEIIMDSLRAELQQSQTDIERLQAQLQINQGFQIELGESQIKLQSAKSQAERYLQELKIAKDKLAVLESQHQQATTELSNSKNWLKQVHQPVRVVAITKLLPKEEFDALWGFGLGSPKVNTILVGGSLTIKGWVLGRRSNVSKVLLTFQQEVLVEAETGLARPAITQQYPDISGAGNSGFECSVAVLGIPLETELAIVTVLEDKSIIPLCAIALKQSDE